MTDIESRLKKKCSSHLMCAICRDVMREASALPCGHEFCNECIRVAFSIKTTCPLCVTRFKKSRITPSYAKRKRIERLIIKCKNESLGCTVHNSIKAIELHEHECDFGPEVKLRKEIEELESKLISKQNEMMKYKKRKAIELPIANDDDELDEVIQWAPSWPRL